MDTKAEILDIAMNLNRIGNWAADDYLGKKERIKTFLGNTTAILESMSPNSLSPKFAGTFSDFKKEYPSLEREGLQGPKKPIFWAEDMMTWGNILTHRSKLLT